MSSDKDINEVLQEVIIRYSQVWEDYALLEEGLNIQPDDHVLSIASAGCNALALLLKEPASVTAVDLNPAQTAIVHLKKEAITHFNHEEFVNLVGARHDMDRLELYQRVRDTLVVPAREFWDTHIEILRKGFIHFGRFELYFRSFQEKLISKMVPSEDMRAFLNLEDPVKQANFFGKVFQDPRFVEPFKAYTSQQMIAKHGRDESQFRFVEKKDLGEHFLERFEYVATQLPTKNNFYLEYLLTSNYNDLTKGPAYLNPNNFEKLKGLVERLHIETRGLDCPVKDHAEGHFSKANLSDLFEYLSEKETESLLRLLATRMRLGGRIAYWNLLVPRSRPESLKDWLEPRPELSEALWKKDRNPFYRGFVVEQVIRG